MAIQVQKFKAEHMKELKEQEAMAYLKPYMTGDHLLSTEKSPFSFTATSKDRVIACAGLVEYWPGRAEAWAVLSPDCKREFLSLHGAVREFLDSAPVRRIEAAVKIGFYPGHRWVRALGFQLEAPLMKCFLVDGTDCALYSRVVA